MPGKHYILNFFGGLICGFFLESDAASLLNITIKVDVNEKTAIDQSYPTGKLIRSVSIIIEIILKLHQKIKIKVLSCSFALDAAAFPSGLSLHAQFTGFKHKYGKRYINGSEEVSLVDLLDLN